MPDRSSVTVAPRCYGVRATAQPTVTSADASVPPRSPSACAVRSLFRPGETRGEPVPEQQPPAGFDPPAWSDPAASSDSAAWSDPTAMPFPPPAAPSDPWAPHIPHQRSTPPYQQPPYQPPGYGPPGRTSRPTGRPSTVRCPTGNRPPMASRAPMTNRASIAHASGPATVRSRPDTHRRMGWAGSAAAGLRLADHAATATDRADHRDRRRGRRGRARWARRHRCHSGQPGQGHRRQYDSADTGRVRHRDRRRGGIARRHRHADGGRPRADDFRHLARRHDARPADLAVVRQRLGGEGPPDRSWLRGRRAT